MRVSFSSAARMPHLSRSDRCELFSMTRFVCPICSNVPNANRQLTPLLAWPACVSPLLSLLFDTCGEREGMRETDGGNPQIPFTFSFHGCLGVRRRRRCSNRPLVIFGCRSLPVVCPSLQSFPPPSPSLLPDSASNCPKKVEVKRGKKKEREVEKTVCPVAASLE